MQGTGAAYIRVSTDHQDTERQHEAIHSFQKRNAVRITNDNWHEDQGWARDEADKRPAFQSLLRKAEAGTIKWIVVESLDRFGTKDEWQLAAYIHRLREAGCQLFDVDGKEYTEGDIGSGLVTFLKGHESKQEQREKSRRVLSGKVTRAKSGEWQGGPPPFGTDVGCFEGLSEVWRVEYDGRQEGVVTRIKHTPNGRTQRFDGKGNFPAHEQNQVLRLVPSHNPEKLAAVNEVFRRYVEADETPTSLGHYLNELGFRTTRGGYFQCHHVERMLADPIYVGRYSWNKRHGGKFNRYSGGKVESDTNYEEFFSTNRVEDWVESEALFPPVVPVKLWEQAREKILQPKRKRHRVGILYLSGLVLCGDCLAPMVASYDRRSEKAFYFCGTYHKFVREGRRLESPCQRKAMDHYHLVAHVERWLEESLLRVSDEETRQLVTTRELVALESQRQRHAKQLLLLPENSHRSLQETRDAIRSLEARMDQLEELRNANPEDLEEIQKQLWKAKQAFEDEDTTGQHRADLLRELLESVVCHFISTGETGAGGGRKHAEVSAITFNSVCNTLSQEWALDYVSVPF